MELRQAYQSRVTTHSRNALAPSYLNTVPFFTNFLLLNSDVNLQSVLLGHDYSPTGFSTRDLVFFDTRFQRALGLRPPPIRSPTRASSSRNTNRAQHTPRSAHTPTAHRLHERPWLAAAYVWVSPWRVVSPRRTPLR